MPLSFPMVEQFSVAVKDDSDSQEGSLSSELVSQQLLNVKSLRFLTISRFSSFEVSLHYAY